ncbi:MAG: hypothetical protein ACTSPU_16035, partial [Promethearchaeota archaeon]
TKPSIPALKLSETSKDSTTPPIPVKPTALIKPKEQVIEAKPVKVPASITPPVVPQNVEAYPIIAPLATVDGQQKAELEKSLMDLKIKKTNTIKMSLDFDMKELTGEITTEELEVKKKKLKTIEANIVREINTLPFFLNKA